MSAKTGENGPGNSNEGAGFLSIMSYVNDKGIIFLRDHRASRVARRLHNTDSLDGCQRHLRPGKERVNEP
jgi:hypothetical protein